MSIADKFSSFCSALRMPDSVVANISSRTKQIARRANLDFRGIDVADRYYFYAGSYGRGTDIHTSDIDIIIELPWHFYERYDSYTGNGQSALIQALKDSIKRTYSTSYLRGDGQVVKLDFSDGTSYEIVPCFLNKDGESYTYPDTNNGGRWKTTNPRAEIREINSANTIWNKNLKRLCRMARAWKEKWSVPIGGLLLDTLAYNFLSKWDYKDKSFMFYDWMTRDFFHYLSGLDETQEYWIAPGSRQYVYSKGDFKYKALRCYNIAIEAIDYENNDMKYSADQKWREIYGTKF